MDIKHIQKVKSFAAQLGKDMNDKWEYYGQEFEDKSSLEIRN